MITFNNSKKSMRTEYMPAQQKSVATASKRKTPSCAICGKHSESRNLRTWISVRPHVSDLILADHQGWQDGQYICREDLAKYRKRYVERLLEEERGELSSLDRQVLESLEKHETVSQLPNDTIEEQMSFGDRVADRVASFGGSWTFILSFVGVLVLWMLLNVTGWIFRPFDIYPFIFLNLVLSCVAALQAPVIMMSQRRQEQKDQIRNENDYKVNLKAELEIRQLHEKIDHQLAHQWQRLAEMQEIQIELLEEQNSQRSK
jgi:uncharacterized membrane protein